MHSWPLALRRDSANYSPEISSFKRAWELEFNAKPQRTRKLAKRFAFLKTHLRRSIVRSTHTKWKMSTRKRTASQKTLANNCHRSAPVSSHALGPATYACEPTGFANLSVLGAFALNSKVLSKTSQAKPSARLNQSAHLWRERSQPYRRPPRFRAGYQRRASDQVQVSDWKRTDHAG